MDVRLQIEWCILHVSYIPYNGVAMPSSCSMARSGYTALAVYLFMVQAAGAVLVPTQNRHQAITRPTAHCFAVASRAFHLPPLVLPALWSNERGAAGEVVPDPNGTADYGPMQINSLWLPLLRPLGITPTRLADDGCLNVWVAGAILSRERRRANGDLWRAIGWYHSHTPALAHAYRRRLLSHLRAALKQLPSSPEATAR